LQTMELMQAADPQIIEQTTIEETPLVQVVETIEKVTPFNSATFNVASNPNTCSLSNPVVPIHQPKLTHGDGWWAQEAEGRWMRNEEAVLSLTMPETLMSGLPSKYLLKFSGVFFLDKPNAITATIDGKVAAVTEVTDEGTIIIGFTSSKTAAEIDVALRLSVPQVQSPKDLGISTDDRTLLYFLKSVELVAA